MWGVWVLFVYWTLSNYGDNFTFSVHKQHTNTLHVLSHGLLLTWFEPRVSQTRSEVWSDAEFLSVTLHCELYIKKKFFSSPGNAMKLEYLFLKNLIYLFVFNYLLVIYCTWSEPHLSSLKLISFCMHIMAFL